MEVREIGKKGGEVSSKRKELAARLRGYKFAKTTKTRKEAIQKVVDKLLDPEFAEAELLLYAQDLANIEDLSDNQKIRLLEVLGKTHTTIFGSKQRIIQANFFGGENMARMMLDKEDKKDGDEEDGEETE